MRSVGLLTQVIASLNLSIVGSIGFSADITRLFGDVGKENVRSTVFTEVHGLNNVRFTGLELTKSIPCRQKRSIFT